VNLGNRQLIIGGAFDTTITGTISGAQDFGIFKLGAGKLTLTKSNTYTGTTSVLGGVLSAAFAGNDSGSAVGSSAMFIYNGGVVMVDADNALGYSGREPAVNVFTGGTLTVSAGFTQHLGAVNLNGGTLASAA